MKEYWVNIGQSAKDGGQDKRGPFPMMCSPLGHKGTEHVERGKQTTTTQRGAENYEREKLIKIGF